MPFRFDVTSSSALAVCRWPLCPWRELHGTRDAAQAAAATHDRAVHGSDKAAAALAARRRRSRP